MTDNRPAPTATVLVVEDDEGIAELERSRLADAGYTVILTGTAEGALAVVRCGRVDIVLLDNRLPGGTDGLDLYASMKAAGHDPPVILVTGFSDEATAVRALRAGVRDFVTKSVAYLDYLPEAVGRVLRQVATERWLAAQHAVAVALAEAATLADAAPRLLRAVCEATGWATGALWSVDREVSALRCVGTWGCDPSVEAALRNPPGRSLLRPGAGPPGRVWASGEPVWVPSVAADPTEPPVAAGTGRPRGGFAFPITFGREALGVAEFFGCEGPPPDRELLRVFAALGSQVGQFVERERTAQAQRESEERLRVALRAAGGGAWAWDLETGTGWWSAEMYDLWGLAPGTPMATESSLALIHERDRDAVVRAARDAVASGAPYFCEFRVAHSARGERWMASHGQVVRSGGGQPTRLLGITLDVSDRRAAAATIQLRDRAIEAVALGILITAPDLPDNPIVYASPGFERLTGYAAAEAVGRNCRFLQGRDTDPGSVALVRAAISAAQPCTVELLNYKKDGTPFWNELSVSPVRDATGAVTHFVGVQADVTARRRLEEQFRQVQKMEAIGQLAGGVAHDFNNLLTVINGYSDLLLERLAGDAVAGEMAAEVRKAGERATGLTSQLLAFSRQAILEPRVLDVNAAVADTARMLARLIGEDVRLTTTLDPHAGKVRVDPGQFGQVLMNLAVNARDAMPTGGQLTVETRCETRDPGPGAGVEGGRPGRHVLVAVSDTGTGMTDEVKARIFEPFFTTKGPGKGTGLGLATVYGIVKQSGGAIEVYSELGVGTTFKVYLPAVDRAGVPEAVEFAPVLGGTETVLLVEDQADVRRFARAALETYGYTVVEAPDGPAAIAEAEQHGGHIDLVVTDVVMPGMSGRHLAEALRGRRPELRVLYMSGYTDDAVVRHGILHSGVAFLRKPFTPLSLARKVRETLDQP